MEGGDRWMEQGKEGWIEGGKEGSLAEEGNWKEGVDGGTSHERREEIREKEGEREDDKDIYPHSNPPDSHHLVVDELNHVFGVDLEGRATGG